jgi:hypothetical protein
MKAREAEGAHLPVCGGLKLLVELYDLMFQIGFGRKPVLQGLLELIRFLP